MKDFPTVAKLVDVILLKIFVSIKLVNFSINFSDLNNQISDISIYISIKYSEEREIAKRL